MRHAVILSDLHLWQGTSSPALWMRYRDRDFFPDAEVARLVGDLCARLEPGTAEFVFDGDVFDFDVAPVVNAVVRELAPPRNARESAARMAAILDDHPRFLDALALVLAEGHEVVFIAGNHDVQLCFAAVRDVLADRIIAAYERHAALGSSARSPRDRILFRQWFHRTRNDVHVEHGNQYDRYCSVRYPLEPLRRDARTIQPTMGSLVMRHLISRMGYFNPNVDSTFLLTTRQYVHHWARYYLFSRRSLAMTWLFGSMRVAWELMTSNECADSRRADRNLRRAVDETGSDPDSLAQHSALFALPSLRQASALLQLDRVLIGSIVVCAAIAARFAPAVALALASWAALLALAMRGKPGDRGLDDVYDGIDDAAVRIASIHDARGVVFGHTHAAHESWVDGRFIGNCGTWAPMFSDVECRTPLERGRPFVWLWGDRETLRGGLMRWADDRIEPGRTDGLELPNGPLVPIPGAPVTQLSPTREL